MWLLLDGLTSRGNKAAEGGINPLPIKYGDIRVGTASYDHVGHNLTHPTASLAGQLEVCTVWG